MVYFTTQYFLISSTIFGFTAASPIVRNRDVVEARAYRDLLPRQGTGSQFITGPCTSDADCASGCCGFNTGKCAGAIIALERDGGCGFGATPNDNAAQKLGHTGGITSKSTGPPGGSAAGSGNASGTADNSGTSSTGSGATTSGSGKPPGQQFITGPCGSDADCASGCCGFNTGKCAGAIIALERDGGCGFGSGNPNDNAAQAMGFTGGITSKSNGLQNKTSTSGGSASTDSTGSDATNSGDPSADGSSADDSGAADSSADDSGAADSGADDSGADDSGADDSGAEDTSADDTSDTDASDDDSGSGATTSDDDSSSPSSSAAAPAATSATASSDFHAANGKQAESENAKFASLSKDAQCTSGDQACIGGAFAQCANGKFVSTACSAGLVCKSLPLVNKAGTSIACTTQADADARIKTALSS